ncbi:MAG: hypothetical protein H0W39_01180 [Sphingomonas sp.]|nr:hypothetical protein [Sphingomonas sp.]
MIEIAHLLAVADAYKQATSLEDVTVSHRLFGDSKKLAALRTGSDITLGRFNAALHWFSANWPAAAVWPDEFNRPEPTAPTNTPTEKAVA